MNTFVSDENGQEEESPRWTMTFSPGAPFKKRKAETLSEWEKWRVAMIILGRAVPNVENQS